MVVPKGAAREVFASLMDAVGQAHVVTLGAEASLAEALPQLVTAVIHTRPEFSGRSEL